MNPIRELKKIAIELARISQDKTIGYKITFKSDFDLDRVRKQLEKEGADAVDVARGSPPSQTFTGIEQEDIDKAFKLLNVEAKEIEEVKL